MRRSHAEGSYPAGRWHEEKLEAGEREDLGPVLTDLCSEEEEVGQAAEGEGDWPSRDARKGEEDTWGPRELGLTLCLGARPRVTDVLGDGATLGKVSSTLLGAEETHPWGQKGA